MAFSIDGNGTFKTGFNPYIKNNCFGGEEKTPNSVNEAAPKTTGKTQYDEELLEATPSSAYGKALTLSNTHVEDPKIAEQKRVLAQFTTDVHSLLPPGFASKAIKDFTPEEHEQYMQAMMSVSPFMGNLGKITNIT